MTKRASAHDRESLARMQTNAAVPLRRGVVEDLRTDCNGLAEYEKNS